MADSFFSALGNTLKSCAKLVLLSRSTTAPAPSHKGSRDIIILGNGPSLNDTIARHSSLLASKPTVAVNFMASSPIYNAIRPDFYVLADPLFFKSPELENVAQLWNALSKTDFPMTLLVPVKWRRQARRLLGRSAPKVKVEGFNFIGLSGFFAFEKSVYNRRRGMPRPRNVLIPAIMNAIWAGYKDIYVVGADHSWLETLRVSDQNHVVSVQPHFYADSEKELKRSETEYKNIRLHQLLESFAIAFRSYHILNRYALATGVRIYNSTPKSYIDAFERRPLGEMPE